MITSAHIEVTPHANPDTKIVISPFGPADIASIQPFDPTSAPYESARTVQELLTATPEEIISRLEKDTHMQCFGVFAGNTMPENFAGVVSLDPLQIDQQHDLTTIYGIQTLSAQIFRRQHQHRGMGTAAVLGVMQHAIDIAETGIFSASTSAYNTPARRGLRRLGFLVVSGVDGGVIEHHNSTTSPGEDWHFHLDQQLCKLFVKPSTPPYGPEAFGLVAAQHTVRTF